MTNDMRSNTLLAYLALDEASKAIFDTSKDTPTPNLSKNFKARASEALSYAKYAYLESTIKPALKLLEEMHTVQPEPSLPYGLQEKIHNLLNMNSPFSGPGQHDENKKTFFRFHTAQDRNSVHKSEIEKYHRRFQRHVGPIMEQYFNSDSLPASKPADRQQGMAHRK